MGSGESVFDCQRPVQGAQLGGREGGADALHADLRRVRRHDAAHLESYRSELRPRAAARTTSASASCRCRCRSAGIAASDSSSRGLRPTGSRSAHRPVLVASRRSASHSFGVGTWGSLLWGAPPRREPAPRTLSGCAVCLRVYTCVRVFFVHDLCVQKKHVKSASPERKSVIEVAKSIRL